MTEVLSELNKSYGLSFSFASNITDSCIVNLTDSFSSPELAIYKLCEPFNLSFKKMNNVYIIHEERKSKKKKLNLYKIHIRADATNEELGLSKIKINGSYYLSDINGNFTFSSKQTKLDLQISYLGYLSLDTTLTPREKRYLIELKPFFKNLTPVEVSGERLVEYISIGKDLGRFSVNSISNGFLPGESNSGIFNSLRLQAGVLAAGEQTSDYIIWNSYKGQNHIVFDGITLFRSNTYDQSISGINPNVVKTIEVYKGGYNADIGDRVGGVVDIKSKTGSFKKWKTILNFNNALINGYLNVPFRGKASLQASVRHSFDNPFDVRNLSSFKKYILPKTNFTDLNLKFTSLIKGKNPFRISVILNKDGYRESLKDSLSKVLAINSTLSQQSGLSVYYGKNWKSGGLTDVSISYSKLSTTFINQLGLNTFGNTQSSISEQSVKMSHTFRATKLHQVKLGINGINNVSAYRNDSSSNSFKKSAQNLMRFNVYVTDSWKINSSFNLNYGLKVEMPVQLTKLVLQPRLSLKYKLKNYFNLYASWGIFNQFMSELAITDKYQNNLFHWSILDEGFKSNRSNHYVVGTSIVKNGWKVSSEFFYKSTANLLEFYLKDENYISLSSGSSKTYGLDMFVSKTIKKHKFWAAYSVGESHDYFKYYSNTTWQAAEQNQLHELKTAFILNFNPIHISANYVYGSGLTYTGPSGELSQLPYSRLDIAIKYNLQFKNLNTEIGFSILNLLNHKNLNLNSFNNFPELKNQFVLSTPFTPLMHVKLNL